MSRQRRTLAAVLAAFLTFALAACDSGGDDVSADRKERSEKEERAGKKAKKQRDKKDGGASGAGTAGEQPGGADNPAPDDGGTAAGDGGATTGDGGGTSGDGGGTSGDGGEQTARGVDPAAAGRYTYDVDGEVTRTGALAGTEPMPPTAQLTVRPPEGAVQRSILDGRDSEGQGSVTTTDLVYGRRGVSLSYLKIATRMGGISQTYEFRPEPPEMVAPAGAGVGDHVEFDMESTDGGIRVHVEIDVVDTERLTIGGEAVDTFKVRQVSTFEGDFEGKITTVANLSPEHSLSVRERTESDIDATVMQIHSESTSVLRSLRPR